MQEFSGKAHSFWYWSSAVNVTSGGPQKGEGKGEEMR